MAGHDGRLLARHHAHAVLLQVAAVEHAPIGEVPRRAGGVLANAEKVLAADVERKIGGQLAPVLLEEADQAAEVVKVPVARNKRLGLRAIDLHDLHVVEERGRRIAEVEQDLARRRPCVIRARARGPTRYAASCAGRWVRWWRRGAS